MAKWYYVPSEYDAYYCDNCVPRGCSCNWRETLLNSGEYIEDHDEQGRLFPCCEYDFDEFGFIIENENNL